MNNNFETVSRPGNLALSLFAFGGLTLLAAALWNVASSYVLLLFIPALLITLYQMIVTPTYGLRVQEDAWTIIDAGYDVTIPTAEIAYLDMPHDDDLSRARIVLRSGESIPFPEDIAIAPLDMIRKAGQCGVAVRTR